MKIMSDIYSDLHLMKRQMEKATRRPANKAPIIPDTITASLVTVKGKKEYIRNVDKVQGCSFNFTNISGRNEMF